MSSAQNKPHQSNKSASPPESQADTQTPPVAQPPSSESHMDQSLDSPLTATPPAPSIPSEVMSSTETTDTTPSLSPAPIPPKPPQPPAIEPSTVVPASTAPDLDAPKPPTAAETVANAEAPKAEAPKGDAPNSEQAAEVQATEVQATEAQDAASQEKDTLSRQQPIPPASEPMQYRAIGLVRGKYVASEDQFTRGTVETDDGVTLGAVLLGRVMSLVKKHLDLEQPHLWVVYPRTREKGDADLHVQIVGVWEPEKLSRMDNELNLDEEDVEVSELDENEEKGESLVTAVEDMPVAADTDPDLDDKYFSVRGEVVYQSIEENRLLVKIRRAPRPGSDESKAFKVSLNGTLEGKAVGYFWDLNVQRQGIDLVVQDGTMIGAVPPQKRSKNSFRDGGSRPYRRGGPGGGRPSGGRPSSRPSGGGSKPRWNNAPRDGQPRPTRSDRPSAPSPNRPPTAKPVIKRRPQENSEEG